MALKRYAGNMFDGDSISDRNSIPLTLPDGTYFLNLSDKLEYVLQGGVWKLVSPYGFYNSEAETISAKAVTSIDIYNSGINYSPLLTVPCSTAEPGPPIIGGKIGNLLVNYHQRGSVAAAVSNMFAVNTDKVYKLENNYQEYAALAIGGKAQITYTFSGQTLPRTAGNDNYTAFCVIDSLSGRPTGIYVDFYGNLGVWENVISNTGNNLFVGSIWRTGDVNYANKSPVTGVRFRLNYPYDGASYNTSIREIGLWHEDFVLTTYTTPLLNKINIFETGNIFKSMPQFSGGSFQSGYVLTAIDNLGNAQWQQTTGNENYFNRNNQLITPKISTDKFFISGISYLPNITIPFSQGELDMPILGAKLTNALANYHQRGVITVTNGTGCSITNSANLYTLNNTFQDFSTVTVTGQDARVILEFSGQTLPTASHAVWEPFVITRLMTNQPTGITVDLYGTNGQWQRLCGTSGGALFTGTVWRGEPTTFTPFPATGFRFTIDYPHNGTTNYSTFLTEVGIWNRNYIPTSFTHPLLNKSNTFESAQILKSTIQISGGNPVPGYVLTATDTLGNAVWRGQTGLGGTVASSTGAGTIYKEYWSVTGNLPSGSIVTIPNSRTYETGNRKLQVFTDGQIQQTNSSPIIFDNDYFEQSTTSVRYSYALPSGSILTYLIFN